MRSLFHPIITGRSAIDASLGLIGETELLPANSDAFSSWSNGWLDESTGGTDVPRVFNDRATTGVAYDGYTVFESTTGTNLLQITSPPIALNSNKNLFIAMDAKTFSGTPSINGYLLGYESGSDTSTNFVQFMSSYNPGSSWARFGVRVNANGGASPAIPGSTDRAIIQLTLASNNNIKIGIKNFYIGHEELFHTDQLGFLSGGHEAYFDGTNVFVSNFFSGFIGKVDGDGVYVGNITTGGGVDPHEITGQGDYLYCAEWGAERITKRLKTAHVGSSPVGSIATSSQVFSVCILGEHLFASTVDKTLYKIRLSDFTTVGTYTIDEQNNSSTQATLLGVGDYLWMHTTVDGKVLKIDPADGAVLATINAPASFGTSTRNYGFGKLGTKLYIAFHNGTLVEYDTETATISNSWDIGVAATSQIKSDDKAIWFVGQTPFPYLIRFEPSKGVFHQIPMRQVGGGKWCEIVGNQVWCGGFDSGRIQRFARY